MKKWLFLISLFVCFDKTYASSVFIPMDLKQSNHLKAYGIAYWYLQKDMVVCIGFSTTKGAVS